MRTALFNYNHAAFLQDVKEGVKRVNTCDVFTGYRERVVKKSIVRTVVLPDGQKRWVKEGENTFVHSYEYNNGNDKIKIDGKIYAVRDSLEFAIKIQKTQLQAVGGARGLIRFLCSQSPCSDSWESKITNNCKGK